MKLQLFTSDAEHLPIFVSTFYYIEQLLSKKMNLTKTVKINVHLIDIKIVIEKQVLIYVFKSKEISHEKYFFIRRQKIKTFILYTNSQKLSVQSISESLNLKKKLQHNCNEPPPPPQKKFLSVNVPTEILINCHKITKNLKL